MALFAYEAFSKDGNRVQGVIDATSRQQARELLTRQGLYPISITPSSGEGQTFFGRLFGPRISLKQKILFTKQLAVLLKSGVPLLDAFDLLIEQFEGSIQALLISVRDRLKEGEALAQALSGYPGVFDNIYIQLVKAGEASGKLETILFRLTEYMERRQEIQRKVSGALQYPIIQLVIIGAVLLLMLTMVLPQLKDVFSMFGQNLPTLTRFMLGLSDVLTNYWVLILLICAAIGILIFFFLRSELGQKTKDALSLKLPVIRYITKTSAVVQFCYTFGILLEGGVNLAQALDIVCNIIDNRQLAESLRQARDKIVKQGRIAQYLKETGMFPPIAVYLIKTGEESGQLDAMLLNVAKTYEDDLKELIDGATALISPVMMVLMALVVGTIIFAIAGPMMRAGDLLQQPGAA